MNLPFRKKQPSPLEAMLAELVLALKGIKMDTASLNTAIANFSKDFSIFATDLATFLKGVSTPQNAADVAAAVAALQGFDAQVKNLDAAVNPPPPPPPPPPPAV